MVNHFTLALSGSAQSLATGLTGAGDPCKQILLQAGAANAHVVYVGGNQRTLTTSDYGFLIPVPVSTVPVEPIHISGTGVSVGDFQVLGTISETVHITLVY